MNITAIVAKSTFLRYNPEAWDAVIPHTPTFHTPIREYITGTLVREIRRNVADQQFAGKLDETAKGLVNVASKMLSAEFSKDFLDTDDLCPPYLGKVPHPIPHSGSGPQPQPWFPWFFGPQPDPWLESAPRAIQEIALAVAIRDLANVTTLETASAALKEAGEALMKQASGRAYEDYCATPAKPHAPHSRDAEVVAR
jgi:hypothetical protein